jgi:hypothetical protein
VTIARSAELPFGSNLADLEIGAPFGLISSMLTSAFLIR